MSPAHWMRVVVINLIAAAVAAGCRTPPVNVHDHTVISEQPLKGYSRVNLAVVGLSCPLCDDAVRRSLARVRGIEFVDIDRGAGVVIVQLAQTCPPPLKQIECAILNAGFALKRAETE